MPAEKGIIPGWLESFSISLIALGFNEMTNTALGAGMGTSGLVGPLATYAAMSGTGTASGILILEIITLHFVAPAIIALAIHLLMSRLGLVKPGDMKIV